MLSVDGLHYEVQSRHQSKVGLVDRVQCSIPETESRALPSISRSQALDATILHFVSSLRPGLRIVEVGSGPGDFTQYLARLISGRCEITGIEARVLHTSMEDCLERLFGQRETFHKIISRAGTSDFEGISNY